MGQRVIMTCPHRVSERTKYYIPSTGKTAATPQIPQFIILSLTIKEESSYLHKWGPCDNKFPSVITLIFRYKSPKWARILVTNYSKPDWVHDVKLPKGKDHVLYVFEIHRILPDANVSHSNILQPQLRKEQSIRWCCLSWRFSQGLTIIQAGLSRVSQ